MKDEIDFVPADKHQRFLQIDTIILGLCVAANYAQTYTYAWKSPTNLWYDFDGDGQAIPK